MDGIGPPEEPALEELFNLRLPGKGATHADAWVDDPTMLEKVTAALSHDTSDQPRDWHGRFSSKGQMPTTHTVRTGKYTARYSTHTNKRIRGPSLPLKNYRQRDIHSCGFVAALTVARYFEPSKSAHEVLNAVRPSRTSGIDRERLTNSLGRLGVKAEYKDNLTISKLRNLVEAGTPVVLTVYPPNYSSDHWVTVQGFDEDRIHLTNYKSLSLKEFEKQWYDKGEGLVCTRSP